MSELSPFQRRELRQLIPSFILEKSSGDENRGRFAAAGLFMDISGFTHLTDVLMEHSDYGAEVLASLVDKLFDPLVKSVLAFQGYITGFAGDAFLALFPVGEGQTEVAAARRALAAGRDMQAYFVEHGAIQTLLGGFRLTGKVGLALGDVDWGILASRDSQRAAYFFRGSTVIECARAENLAAQGQLVATERFAQAVADFIQPTFLEGHVIVGEVLSAPAARQPVETRAVEPTAAGRFLPPALLGEAPKGEFRPVLSLFISLQGDPADDDLAAFMSTFYELQATYGGYCYRINFDDKGCNMAVFWGAPQSHENDIQRALAMALALRRASPLPLRMGATYRVAYAGFVGASTYQEYTCYGRGVNLAARQMAEADWGAIWLDADSARRASQLYEVAPIGRRTFRGFPSPQPVFELAGERTIEAETLYAKPLAGRAAELARMRSVIQPIFDGRFAGVIGVTGEAGAGKSRFLHEFLTTPPVADGARAFVCQTDAILRRPLNPFRHWAREYFHQSPDHSPERNLAQFQAILNDLIDQTADQELRAELLRSQSFLGNLLDLHWPDSLYELTAAELRAENTYNALKSLLKGESRRQPVVVLVEDVHALDVDSQEFLRRLVRHIDDTPLAVVLSSREPVDSPAPAAEIPFTEIQLGPLDRAAAAELIKALVDEHPEEALVDQLLELSGGNPLFLEQTVLYLQARDLWDAFRRAGQGRVETSGFLPLDIRSLLVARLDQLPGRLKNPVQVAAVLGREFEVPILTALLGAEAEVKGLLALGVSNGIWYPVDDRRYLFHHALLRDAAYETQLTARRKELHRLAAETFVANTGGMESSTDALATIAYHYDQGGVEREAVHYYDRAGERAAAQFFNDPAINYYTRALELTPEQDVTLRCRLLFGREAVLNLVGRREEQRHDLRLLEELLQGAPDPASEADLALRHAAYCLSTGDYQGALTWAMRSTEAAALAEDMVAEARALLRIGRAHWQQGQAADAEPFLLRALDMAERGEATLVSADCHYDLGVVRLYHEDHQAAEQHALEALERYVALEDAKGRARANDLLGTIYRRMGDLQQAEAQHLSALKLAHESGWRMAETAILSHLANIHFEYGDYDTTSSFLSKALALCRHTDNAEFEAVILDTLGLVEQLQGNVKAAIQHYRESARIAEEIGNNRTLGYTLTHLGFSLTESGEYGDAESVLERALQIRRKLHSEPETVDTLSVMAHVAYQQGHHAAARRHAQSIGSYIDAHGATGLEFPAVTCLIGYRILKDAAGGPDDGANTAAEHMLKAGCDLLLERAQMIQDAARRHQFLEQVPYNRELLAEWASLRR